MWLAVGKEAHTTVRRSTISSSDRCRRDERGDFIGLVCRRELEQLFQRATQGAPRLRVDSVPRVHRVRNRRHERASQVAILALRESDRPESQCRSLYAEPRLQGIS